ncbi:BlaI/MecI/CopY family transcriptional regulator [Segetibacter sp.]|jgi:BlaI family penicillinase repressor|uniref:BlaI/MecI/CopY family transcriptional regulator n=1 Tax=Segetibacter sp. TaxID=2231182 RepID=UPI00263224FC|nr:BlaI/MecI/CopY family transcriptional regulator [Segetibacter sp.]MCW3082581.1 BlaI/MecI/CopY family transcriptional regulator [Segetibacter sp.]
MKKTLTKAEEQIMQAVWKIEKGFLKEIIDALPEPKPHSNTVATILKILVDKKFVGTETFGRQNQYSALVAKDEYTNSSIKTLVEGYFDGSFSNAVSFMVEKNKLSVADLELLLKQIKTPKK